MTPIRMVWFTVALALGAAPRAAGAIEGASMVASARASLGRDFL